jgi:ADP-ribosylglycohydrolase
MIGGIIGDVIGSAYEFNKTKDYDFPVFIKDSTYTDDTILTIATASALLNDGRDLKDYGWAYKKYALDYPNKGFGGRFEQWAKAKEILPAYNSYGNGSAMRVGPVGFIFKTIEETIAEAKRTAVVTHNHPEGIKGAEAISAAIFLARQGDSKKQIKKYIGDRFDYNLHFTIKEIRPTYTFDVTCQGSVPQAIVSFIDSTDYESTIRNAISMGGDADTLACIAGFIAEAYYGYSSIKDSWIRKTLDILPQEFKIIIHNFYNKVREI